MSAQTAALMAETCTKTITFKDAKVGRQGTTVTISGTVEY